MLTFEHLRFLHFKFVNTLHKLSWLLLALLLGQLLLLLSHHTSQLAHSIN